MEVLLPLLIVLVPARLMGEAMLRIGQPSLTGEMLAGIGLGLLAANSAVPFLAGLGENDVLRHFSDVGAFFLMLAAGMEMRPRELVRSSRAGLAVAVGGMAVPLSTGFALTWLVSPDSPDRGALALLVGVALSISAVPATTRLFGDLGLLHHRIGRTVVSAAILDDVLGLVLMAVLTAVIQTGAPPDPGGLLLLLSKVAAFFMITVPLSIYSYPLVSRMLGAARAEAAGLSALLVAGLAYAVLADALGMHFVLGPFVAGLLFERGRVGRPAYRNLKATVERVMAGFMGPIFFVSMGLHVDLSALIAVPWFVAALIAVAFFGKFIGAGIPAYAAGLPPREAAAVGIGMSSRGAIEIVIANIALEAGLIGSGDIGLRGHLFSTLVLMALTTTLLAPVALRVFLPGIAHRSRKGT